MNARGLVADKMAEVLAEYREEGVSITPSDIRGKSRKRTISSARKQVAWRLYATGLMTHEEIGAALGRHRTQSIYLVKTAGGTR